MRVTVLGWLLYCVAIVVVEAVALVIVVQVLAVVVVAVVVVLIVYCIRSSGEYTVKTIAGNGDQGHVDGEGSQAQFHGPCGISTDMNNNIIVGEEGNHRIRMISHDRW